MSSYYFVGLNSFTGAVLVPAGSVGTPGLGVGTASNGLYAPAANQLAVSTNGTQAVLWDASQNTTVPAGAAHIWNGRAQMQSPADGIMLLENNAGTGFTRLQLGGTTASFPAIKRSSATLAFRLADDSADAAVTAAAGTFTGVITGPAGTNSAPGLALGASGDGVFQVSAGVLGLTGSGTEVARFSSTLAQVPAASVLTWNGRAKVSSPADGQLQLQLNAGGSTTLSTGIIFGTDASLVRDKTASINGLRVMNGNQSANLTMNANGFNSTNDANVVVGTGFATASQSGLGVLSGVLKLTTSNNFAVSIDTSQNISFFGTGGATNNNSASINLQANNTTTTTNSGAATQTCQAIPAGALVLGVVARVTTAITGCTTFDIGDGTTATKWGAGLAVASGTTATNANWLDGSAPAVYNSSEHIVLTAHGGGGVFTTGAVEIIIYYWSATAPSS